MMSRQTLTVLGAVAGILLSVASRGVVAQGRLLSAVNYAEFKYDSTVADVEIYTSISPAELSYHSVNDSKGNKANRFSSEVRLNFKFRNLSTDSIFRVRDNIPIGTVDTSSIQTLSRFVTITRLLFEAGKYEAMVYVSGSDSSSVVDSARFDLVVHNFPGRELSISDIELCSDISNGASEEDLYYKNTLHVVPNPKALYGLGMPTISYYAEVYGLGKSNDKTEYAIAWNVVDTYGRVLKGQPSVKTGSSSSVVEIGSTNISDLPSGKYAMELTVADSILKRSASTSQYFFIYNPYVKQPEIAAGSNIDVISSPFFSMGEKELDNIFHASSYLASPQQGDFYKKLTTVDGKRRFLAQFWNEQTTKSGPDGFNSWSEFDKRFNEANVKYKTAFKTGWLTDRGRVYIDYGQPDDIERHSSSSSSKPYQIWTYNSIEGGVIFVFVDLTGFNDYVLIHSTKRGEVENPDWQKYVQLQQ